MKYNKEPYSANQHIRLLSDDRGLHIEDEARALRYLTTVGYFRLSGYMYHLQEPDGSHKFLKGTSFDLIIQHYTFDKALRRLLSEYLERIEVALRALLINEFSLSYGFSWYTEAIFYADHETFNYILREIKQNFQDPQERFLKAFKLKYSDSYPPSNMAFATLSFGKLTRLFKGLNNTKEKQKISETFGLPSTMLSSWLIYLSLVRNICAHHSRLWNRRLTAEKPVIPKRKKYQFYGKLPPNFNSTTYGVVCLIDRLLLKINPNNSFIERLTILIERFPKITTSHMGFPDNWKEEPAWKNKTK